MRGDENEGGMRERNSPLVFVPSHSPSRISLGAWNRLQLSPAGIWILSVIASVRNSGVSARRELTVVLYKGLYRLSATQATLHVYIIISYIHLQTLHSTQ